MPLFISEQAIKNLPVSVDAEVMSGTPVFTGTRVPIDALFANLADGIGLDEFLENFPSVSRPQTVAVLRFCNELIESAANLKK